MSTRTSATGISVNSATVPPLRRPAARRAGFTLIEILVVIVIIGVVIAGALLAFGGRGGDSGLEQERDRLAALIDYARERAELQTLEYGIYCTPTSYRILVYDPRRALWMVDTLDDVLRPRRLPPGVLLSLAIEGRDIVLEEPKDKLSPEAPKPQVLLLSSGEINSFELTLRRAGTPQRVTLRTNKDGTGVDVGAVVSQP